MKKIRREKLANLQAEGKDPFEITKFNRTHTSADVKDMQETKIKKAYMDYNANNIAEYYIAHQIFNNAESDKTKSGVTIAGSKKKNGINRLVELGYTRSEAKRLYERMNGG